jgi:DNA-directed RNA polymerase alpha subunit
MTPLDKLTKQIEDMLRKQKILIEQNQKLKEKLDKFSNSNPTITKLQKEKEEQTKVIEELSRKIETVLNENG